MDIIRHESNTRYSEVVEIGNYLFLSGQANWEHLDIRSQTKAVFEQVGKLLEKYGSDLAHVLNVQLFLAREEDFVGMNEIYDTLFAADAKPARACVITGMVHPDILLEVTVIASKHT